MKEAGLFAFNVPKSSSTITNFLNCKREKLFNVIENWRVLNWSFNFLIAIIYTSKYQ